MSAVDDFDQVLEQWQLATGEFSKGTPEPVQKLFSHQEDVTLANPLGPAARGIGPVARGWQQVAQTQEHAASTQRDGETTSFEIIAKHVTPELAYVVQIERVKAKIGSREDVTPLALRATMIFRPEDGTWKVVHRHADPITTARPAESIVLQE
jgi:ketosteroid isomerase-like protein